MFNIKKADIILGIAIIILGIAFTILIAVTGTNGSKVVVTVGGELYGTYDLNVDQEISIEQSGHINKVTIKDHKVSMVFSDCKNQICVKHKDIDSSNESITCLPNKVMVTIEGSEEGGYDAVSK